MANKFRKQRGWPPEFGNLVDPNNEPHSMSFTDDTDSTRYSGFGGGVAFRQRFPDRTMRDLTESSRREVVTRYPQGKGQPGAVGMEQAPTTISNGRNDERARRSGHGIYASTSTKGERMPMPKNVEDAMPHHGNELASHRSQYKCVEQGVLSNHGGVHHDYDYRTSAASSPSFYTSSTEEHKHKPPCTRHTRGVGCADRLENIGGRDVGPPCGTQPEFRAGCEDCHACRSRRY